MSRALITGGTGFVGSALARRLMALGHEVIITGCRTEQKVQNAKLLEPGLLGIDWTVVKDIDVVFHQAANNDTLCTDREEMMLANVRSSGVLFNRCREEGCRQFVFASSTAVYGDSPAPYVEGQTPLRPLNVYAESKALLEERALEFAREHHVKVVGLRYCNVYGPGEDHKGSRASMIHQLLRRMSQGLRPRLFYQGEQRRDYIHVEDVVEANLCAWKYGKSDVFNCGSGGTASFSELAAWINEGLGTKLETEWIKNPHESAYQNFTQCDMQKAQRLLAFVPRISIRQGVNDACAALRSSG